MYAQSSIDYSSGVVTIAVADARIDRIGASKITHCVPQVKFLLYCILKYVCIYI
jgi:hypothetical protein